MPLALHTATRSALRIARHPLPTLRLPARLTRTMSDHSPSPSPSPSPPAASPPLRYIDVGINLTDPVFQGRYHGGRPAHPPDLPAVLARAAAVGCHTLMVTGSDLAESRAAVALAARFPGTCYATVGVHPCAAAAFAKDPDGPQEHLRKVGVLARDALASGRAVAYGEFGLDYDRLHFAAKEVQIEFFNRQLDLVRSLDLAGAPPPLFLHCRAAVDDFVAILEPHLPHLPRRGLVHSFTGTLDEMRRLVDLGFDIGINGCSMKTQENLDVVKEVPLERLQIETDGPWCEIRPSHASAQYLPPRPAPQKPAPKKNAQPKQSSATALLTTNTAPEPEPVPVPEPAVDADGDPLPPVFPTVKKERWTEGALVKGRNEPATIPNVAYVIAKVKGVPVRQVCDRARQNSVRMFSFGEQS